MKRDDLLNALNGIDRDIVEESARLRKNAKKRTSRWKVILPIAAGLLLAVGAAWVIARNSSRNSTATDGTELIEAEPSWTGSTQETLELVSESTDTSPEETTPAAVPEQVEESTEGITESKETEPSQAVDPRTLGVSLISAIPESIDAYIREHLNDITFLIKSPDFGIEADESALYLLKPFVYQNQPENESGLASYNFPVISGDRILCTLIFSEYEGQISMGKSIVQNEDLTALLGNPEEHEVRVKDASSAATAAEETEDGEPLTVGCLPPEFEYLPTGNYTAFSDQLYMDLSVENIPTMQITVEGPVDNRGAFTFGTNVELDGEVLSVLENIRNASGSSKLFGEQLNLELSSDSGIFTEYSEDYIPETGLRRCFMTYTDGVGDRNSKNGSMTIFLGYPTHPYTESESRIDISGQMRLDPYVTAPERLTLKLRSGEQAVQLRITLQPFVDQAAREKAELVQTFVPDADAAATHVLYADDAMIAVRTETGGKQRFLLLENNKETWETGFDILSDRKTMSDKSRELLGAAERFWEHYQEVYPLNVDLADRASQFIRNTRIGVRRDETGPETAETFSEEELRLLRSAGAMSFETEAMDRFLPMLIAEEFGTDSGWLIFSGTFAVMKLDLTGLEAPELEPLLEKEFGSNRVRYYIVSPIRKHSGEIDDLSYRILETMNLESLFSADSSTIGEWIEGMLP